MLPAPRTAARTCNGRIRSDARGGELLSTQGDCHLLRNLAKAALAVSIASGGLIALSALPASAKTVTITASGAGSLSCSIPATTKIKPALKNDWTQTADFYTAVAAIPTTLLASQTPGTTSAKGSGTCTGTVTDGMNSVTGTNADPIGVSFKLVTNPANPGSGEVSCAALVAATGTPALYNTSVKFTPPASAVGFKIAPTTVIDSSLGHSLSPPGFIVSGGTITGSFASSGGGTSSSLSLIDPSPRDLPISALIQPAETGADAVAGTTSPWDVSRR